MFVKLAIMMFLGTLVSSHSHCNSHKPVCGTNNVTY